VQLGLDFVGGDFFIVESDFFIFDFLEHILSFLIVNITLFQAAGGYENLNITITPQTLKQQPNHLPC